MTNKPLIAGSAGIAAMTLLSGFATGRVRPLLCALR